MAVGSRVIKPLKLPTIETPDQLIMQFFESGVPITKASRDVSYKKSNAIIRTNTNLDLSERKIIDACFFAARHSLDGEMTYAIDMDYFKWLAGLDNSRNSAHLKKCITKIQQNLIQLSATDPGNPDKEFWLSTPYITEVVITSKRIYYKLPDLIRNNLNKPENWTLISLRIRNRFKSQYPYIIYDMCRLEAFRGATDWITLNDLRGHINGGDKSIYPEYRDLYKRVLRPAIEQINAHSDLFITLDVHKSGKAIDAIRFLIEENPEYDSENKRDNLTQLDYEILKKEFGLSNSEISLACQYPPEAIHEKIEFTRHRIQQGKTNPNLAVKFPNKYFLNALSEDLCLTSGDLETKRLKTAQEDAKRLEVAQRVAAKEKTAQSASILVRFEAMNEVEQEKLLSRFKESDNLKRLGKNVALNIKKINEGQFWTNPKYALLKSAFIEFLTEIL